jgi:hypothetical protein
MAELDRSDVRLILPILTTFIRPTYCILSKNKKKVLQEPVISFSAGKYSSC